MILDLGGKVILEKSFMSLSQLNIETSSLSTGVYFVRILTADGSSVFRAMKE
jgi:hypothetical protein